MTTKCKSCDRILTWMDYFVISKEFLRDMELCKDCLIAIMKDILREEEEKEQRRSAAAAAI